MMLNVSLAFDPEFPAEALEFWFFSYLWIWLSCAYLLPRLVNLLSQYLQVYAKKPKCLASMWSCKVLEYTNVAPHSEHISWPVTGSLMIMVSLLALRSDEVIAKYSSAMKMTILSRPLHDQSRIAQIPSLKISLFIEQKNAWSRDFAPGDFYAREIVSVQPT